MKDVDICNVALSLIGGQAITSLDDGSINAKRCKAQYDLARQYLLTEISWPFARKQVALALVGAESGTDENLAGDGQAPIAGWKYTYGYPADCLKVVDIKPDTTTGNYSVYSNTRTPITVQNGIVEYVQAIQKIGTENYRVLATNKQAGLLVYVSDVTETEFYSSDFNNLFAYYLCAKLAFNVTGDLKITHKMEQMASQLMGVALKRYAFEYSGDTAPMINDPYPTGLQARNSGRGSYTRSTRNYNN